MLCEDCKQNQATIHWYQTVNNIKTTKNLCGGCAAKYNQSVFPVGSDFSVQDLFKGMFPHIAHSPIGYTNQSCPNCGLSYQDFSRSGKLGCGSCYTAFRGQLEPLLRRMHGTSKHIGKEISSEGLELKKRLKDLRDELAAHIAKEEYEEAAKVRDKIRNMEAEQPIQPAKEGLS